MSSPWLKLNDAKFSYGSNCLFHGISTEIFMGEFCHLRAEGMRGLTTLTKIMAALLTPQCGDVELFGQDLKKVTREEFLSSRLKLSYSFDTGGLLSNKTLIENILLPIQYHQIAGVDVAEQYTLDLLRVFEIENEKNQRPAMVNSSSRKLSLIARALVTSPQVLILDDPDNGLNKRQVEMVIEAIQWATVHRDLQSVVIASRLTSLWDRLFTHQLVLSTHELRKLSWSHVSDNRSAS